MSDVVGNGKSSKEIVVCPHCGAKNRIGTAPKGEVPACGKCGRKLPWLVQGDDARFTQALDAGVPVLVDFWAPWCGPCRMVAPVLEDLSRELAGRLKIVKLNVDENPEVSGTYRVQSIPTLILFKDGRPVDTLVGAMPKGALLQRLQPHLGE
ncbi:MAG TPA: thioredoxin TrxC [Trueperaceae bacterium]